jgi:hypothetical protein
MVTGSFGLFYNINDNSNNVDLFLLSIEYDGPFTA